MPKPCRTCKHTDPGCLIRIRGEQRIDCWYHEPRETPLLVDELAEALNGMMALMNEADSTGIPPYLDTGFDEVMKAAFAALARHQEEVGDDKA